MKNNDNNANDPFKDLDKKENKNVNEEKKEDLVDDLMNVMKDFELDNKNNNNGCNKKTNLDEDKNNGKNEVDPFGINDFKVNDGNNENKNINDGKKDEEEEQLDFPTEELDFPTEENILENEKSRQINQGVNDINNNNYNFNNPPPYNQMNNNLPPNIQNNNDFNRCSSINSNNNNKFQFNRSNTYNPSNLNNFNNNPNNGFPNNMSYNNNNFNNNRNLNNNNFNYNNNFNNVSFNQSNCYNDNNFNNKFGEFNNQNNSYINNSQNNIFDNNNNKVGRVSSINNNSITPNNKISNNNADIQKMRNIIKICETKYQTAISQFKSVKIPEAKSALSTIIKSMDTLQNKIDETDPNTTSLLSKIATLKKDSQMKLNEYNFMTYQLALKLFKNINYNSRMDLETLAKKFIIYNPFISFDDIYEPSNSQNKTLKGVLSKAFNDLQYSKFRAILLYGPSGSGKSLVAHALAHHLGGVLGQIEELTYYKIPFFVKEFPRVLLESTVRPLVIYIKNIDKVMNKALQELVFLYDKFNTAKRKLIIVVSSSLPVEYLPKSIRYEYIYCIKSIHINAKFDLFKFITDKFGMKMIDEDEIMDFIKNNHRSYSNFDIFKVVKCCLDLNNKNGKSLSGLDKSTLEEATKMIQGSLSPKVIQYYHL